MAKFAKTAKAGKALNSEMNSAIKSSFKRGLIGGAITCGASIAYLGLATTWLSAVGFYILGVAFEQMIETYVFNVGGEDEKL